MPTGLLVLQMQPILWCKEFHVCLETDIGQIQVGDEVDVGRRYCRRDTAVEIMLWRHCCKDTAVETLL